MRISFEELYQQLYAILIRHGLSEEKSSVCARIFAGNSRDGVHSHGLNRFPVFLQQLKDGWVKKDTEPVLVNKTGLIEHWTGNLAPGMYSATICMNRSIELAKANGISCVTLKDTNHWMRGGAYGWQAAANGCIAICATNAMANMPPWGGTTPTLGNNPLVIAVPHDDGHIVLDMAMSQYSYGKLQEFELSNRSLPIAGGFDENGEATTDPAVISATRRTLPIGYWKGSGLSLVLDILVAGISGGKSVAQITAQGQEFGVSQFFLCINAGMLNKEMMEEVIRFTRQSKPVDTATPIRYPGEQTLAERKTSELSGVKVNAAIWEQVKQL